QAARRGERSEDWGGCDGQGDLRKGVGGVCVAARPRGFHSIESFVPDLRSGKMIPFGRWLSAAALAMAAYASQTLLDGAAARAADAVLGGCLVKLQDDVKLAGKEGGVLVQLSVKEGSQVKAGEVIGKIDDSQPQAQKDAAQAGYNSAFAKYKDDV